jgi:DNA-directed RNA polymerase specialized sigma24 family protein
MTKPDGRVTENAEYVKFAERILRGLSKRAGGDVDTLPELRKLQETMETRMTEAVVKCHEEGYSWAEIAARLGITRQAAQQRYGRKAA